ncbi:MAG: hypothetical protein LKF64_12030, partial [Alcaligenes faecalis]|nr:hypothetical protein [Alcaligenes faecalis]
GAAAPATMSARVGARCTDWGVRKGYVQFPDHSQRLVTGWVRTSSWMLRCRVADVLIWGGTVGLSAVSTKGNWRSFKRADFREQGLICRIRQLWSAFSCDGEVVGMLNYATPSSWRRPAISQDEMANEYNLMLVIGAGLSLIAALLHVGVIIVGPSWYQLFGAGDRFVRAAQAGRWFPAVFTAGIALVLAVWAAYALSAAGVIERLPLVRPALIGITSIYLLRGLLGPLALAGTGRSRRFIMISSAICLVYGLVHLFGLVQVWGSLV